MFDIDHFKHYNDHYGHQQGDLALQAVASAVHQLMQRPYDLAARYGGEEFVCLLPGCTAAHLPAKAEQLRAAIEALQLPHAASPSAPWLTISVGAAHLLPQADTNPHRLLTLADAALYQVKHQGRNCVCLAPSTST
jgi:diguanylate cyclase (GGDEF)-like protein